MKLFNRVKITHNQSMLGQRASIGRHTYGADHLQLHTWSEDARLRIGKFCSIADNVHIFLGGNHRVDWISTYPFATSPTEGDMRGDRVGHPASNGDVEIGNDVWIGSHVSIMSGIHIGNGACIAAYSHVVKDVQPYSVVGGNPAITIRMRFLEEVIEEIQSLEWWDWPDEMLRNNAALLCTEPTEAALEALREVGANVSRRDRVIRNNEKSGDN